MNIKVLWPYLVVMVPVLLIAAFIQASFNVDTWPKSTRIGAVIAYVIVCFMLWLHDEDL